MESTGLYMDYKKSTEKEPSATKLPDRYTNTYYWHDHDMDSAKLISPNMLVKIIDSSTVQKEADRAQILNVILCYNWQFKSEFVILRLVHQETLHRYTPQYGRDDNYEEISRADYPFHAYSVDAFKREKPDLAHCLDTL